MKRILCLLLLAAVLLTGCSVLDNMPKPPKVEPEADTTVPAADTASPAPTGESEKTVPEHGVLVQIRRQVREAMDPENQSARILSFSWDEVRVDSERYPEAAEKINEMMATLEDSWYTGRDTGEQDLYGFDAMLSAAEDEYTMRKSLGEDPTEFTAVREVRVSRADDLACVFLVRIVSSLAEEAGTETLQTLIFDSKTGDQLEEVPSVDSQFIETGSGEAVLSVKPLANSTVGVNIFDRVEVAEGGENYLLLIEGRAEALSIESADVEWQLGPVRQYYYCEYLRDGALQLVLRFHGDLPDLMIRYRDSVGEHELLVGLSGLDGSVQLTNKPTNTETGGT